MARNLLYITRDFEEGVEFEYHYDPDEDEVIQSNGVGVPVRTAKFRHLEESFPLQRVIDFVRIYKNQQISEKQR